MASQTSQNPECFVSGRAEKTSKFYYRSVLNCDDLPKYEFEGNWYCILHLPEDGELKSKYFDASFEALQDRKPDDKYRFPYVYFPTDDFDFARIKPDGDVDFEGATFGNITGLDHYVFPGEANFSNAVFLSNETNFEQARFAGRVSFEDAKFNAVNFTEAVFEGNFTRFDRARFQGKSVFEGAVFKSGIFKECVFERPVYFGTDGADFEFHEEFNIKHSNKIRRPTIFADYANFNSAVFEQGASFLHAELNICDFNRATFKKRVWFDKASFPRGVYFNETNFEEDSETSFRHSICPIVADFRRAKVKGYVSFVGTEEITVFNDEKGTLRLDHIRVYGDDKFVFSNVRLRPRWFVNSDARKFIFTNAHWGRRLGFGTTKYVIEESRHLNDKRLLKIACRQLADNAEVNNLYEDALKFRYMSMESERLFEKRTLADRFLGQLYFDSSGYGERWLQAFVVLFLVWLVPFMFYLTTAARFEVEKKPAELLLQATEKTLTPESIKPEIIGGLFPGQAAFYSLNVMAFQKPEPKPADESWLTRLVVIVQTILGPLQAALLALAIRRKFMR